MNRKDIAMLPLAALLALGLAACELNTDKVKEAVGRKVEEKLTDYAAQAIDRLAQEAGLDTQTEADGKAELQRSEIAGKFNCVPSQINYVISTRFSPENGYVVESRRGGGGYIRIRRVAMDSKQLVMHTINAIGDKIDLGSTRALLKNLLAANAIDQKSASLIMAAVGNQALKQITPSDRDAVRANILKHMLVSII